MPQCIVCGNHFLSGYRNEPAVNRDTGTAINIQLLKLCVAFKNGISNATNKYKNISCQLLRVCTTCRRKLLLIKKNPASTVHKINIKVTKAILPSLNAGSVMAIAGR